MFPISRLNIIRPIEKNDSEDVDNLTNSGNNNMFPGNFTPILINTSLYKLFEDFINDPTHIRFGANEKIVTRRLVDHFNEVTGQSISLNKMFPKLMKQFIENNPDRGIMKKSRNEGIMYLGIGLFNDEAPKIKRADNLREKITVWEEKNERRAFRKRAEMDRLREEICVVTSWSDIEYQRLVNMGFINVIKNDNVVNLNAIIEVSRANIIAYTYNKIRKINHMIRGTNSVKLAYEAAIVQDNYLTTINNFPTYTNRLRVAPDVNSSLFQLEKELAGYNNSLVDMPKITHIVYPNIQHINSLVSWLKSHNVHKTRKDMAITQQAAVDDENWTLEGYPEDYVGDYVHTIHEAIN